MRVLFPEWTSSATPSRRRARSSGGKDPSPKALKPIKPGSKRAAVVAWLRKAGRVDIDSAVTGLGLATRQHVFSYLVNLNRDNGYGYTLEGGFVTLLPPGSPQ